MRRWLLLALILSIALPLRLYHLSYQEAWFDEAFSITVSDNSFSGMTPELITDFVHPPLHYYLLHLWTELAGFGVFQARLLSLIFGMLAIVFTWLIAGYLFDSKTALLSALWMAISCLGVTYSQEARSYTMSTCLLAAALYFFFRTLRERRALLFCAFAVSSLLAAYTHYYTLFAILPMAAFALVKYRSYPIPRIWWITAAVLGFLLYLPWLMSGVIAQALVSSKTTVGFQNPRAAVHWFTMASAVNSFNNGKTFGPSADSPWWVYLIGFSLFTLPAAFAVLTAWRPSVKPEQRDALLLLAVLAGLPLIAVLSLSLLGFQYFVRYVLFCTVPYYILAARGVALLPMPRLQAALVFAAVLFSALSIRAYYSHSKGDIRGGLNYIAAGFQPGDCVVSFNARGVRTTLPRQWYVYFRDRPELPTTSLADIAGPDSTSRCRRAWLAYRYEPQDKPDTAAFLKGRSVLEQHWNRVSERRFFGLFVDLYEPATPPLPLRPATPAASAPLADGFRPVAR